MEQLDRIGPHQIRTNFGSSRVANNIFKLGNAGPVTIVIKKATCLPFMQIFRSIWPRIRHVAGDALAQRNNFISKQSFDHNNPVLLEGVDVILRNKWMGHVCAPELLGAR